MGIELGYRGHSHWTMFLLGGLCFLIIGLLNEFKFTWQMPVVYQMLVGATAITTLEFITGCIVNKWLGWGVWNYSSVPFNIMGQVCLPFTFFWFLLSGLIIFLDDWLRKVFFKERIEEYNFGIKISKSKE